MTIKMLLATVDHARRCLSSRRHAQSARRTSPQRATTKKAQAPRTAKSLECSKEADAKNLHGKARKKFMRQLQEGLTLGYRSQSANARSPWRRAGAGSLRRRVAAPDHVQVRPHQHEVVAVDVARAPVPADRAP